MMTRLGVSLLMIVATLDACAPARPQRTSLELQAFQAKEFEATKAVAFASVLSVFQDLGYIVSSASLDTGFITAKSPTKRGFALFAIKMEDTRATAFIEEFGPKKTRVRLNFVQNVETSGGYGQKAVAEKPIEDPQIYQNAFARIQEAIFIRSGTN